MDLFWVYDIPSAAFCAILVGLFVLVGVVGLLLTRGLAQRIFGTEPACNEFVSYTLSGAGVFYGITLGLIAVGAWSTFGEIDNKVSREAAALAALYRDVGMLPEPHRAELQDTLRRYTRQVIDVAWPQQRNGIRPKGGIPFMEEFKDRLLRVRPTHAADVAIFGEVLDEFNVMLEFRRLRIQSALTGMPSTLWLVVFLGAFINIVIMWCFVIERLNAHVIMVVLTASLMGLIVFLTAALDYPFRGEFSIGPDAFELTYEQVMLDDVR